MKGDSGYTLLLILVFSATFLVILSSYSIWGAQIRCPELVQNQLYLNDFNQTNNETLKNDVWTGFGLIFNEYCSGIPFWVWFIILLPMIITAIVIILPNWLAGG